MTNTLLKMGKIVSSVMCKLMQKMRMIVLHSSYSLSGFMADILNQATFVVLMLSEGTCNS